MFIAIALIVVPFMVVIIASRFLLPLDSRLLPVAVESQHYKSRTQKLTVYTLNRALSPNPSPLNPKPHAP